MKENNGKKKKTICLMTNWYPTKENPYYGLFFKEQAFVLSDQFEHIIIHYREHHGFGGKRKDKIQQTNQEKNTVEYGIDVQVPLWLAAWDVLYGIRTSRRGEQVIEGIGKYVLPKRSAYTRKRIGEIIRTYFADVIDVFYCIDAQTEAFTVQCAAEAIGKPYIVSEHAPVPWPGTLISDVNKTAIEKANAFLAISNDKIRQLMLQNIKLPKTTYIGNLIDEDHYPLKKEYHTIKTLIIVAAHSFYKNYDMFISVMNQLSERTSAVFRIMIVGYAANKGYSKNTEKFEQQIKNSRFAAFTEMIPSVPHDQIGEVLNRADAFIMTSIQEGQPVSALEAACCGLPIFSTRCGGVEDYINESNGRIYDLTDEEGFAEGLKEFIEGRMTFSPETIRQQVVGRFGKEAFRQTFSNIFNKVMERA